MYSEKLRKAVEAATEAAEKFDTGAAMTVAWVDPKNRFVIASYAINPSKSPDEINKWMDEAIRQATNTLRNYWETLEPGEAWVTTISGTLRDSVLITRAARIALGIGPT